MDFVVKAIEHGTVIDHINAHSAITILNFLNLVDRENQITLGINLPSQSMGLKDIIKVFDWEITPDLANKVAIFAPQATINIIRNGKVDQKYMVNAPQDIESIIPCPNIKCITRGEKHPGMISVVQQIGNNLKLKCRYCGKTYSQTEVQKC